MKAITQVNIYVTLFYSIIVFQYEIRRWFRKWLQLGWWRDEVSYGFIQGRQYKASCTIGLRNRDRLKEWWNGRKQYVFKLVGDPDPPRLQIHPTESAYINMGMTFDSAVFVRVHGQASFYMDNISLIEINKSL